MSRDRTAPTPSLRLVSFGFAGSVSDTEAAVVGEGET